jgi:hypothetical protein
MWNPRAVISHPERPDRADFYAAAVYGSIVAAAAIGAFREERARPEDVALALLGTMVVFWIVHVWAEMQGERIHHSASFSIHQLLVIARAEWPLVEAGFGPTLFLFLGWAGVINETLAQDLALVACIVQLFAWGFFLGHRASRHWWSAVLSGTTNGLLGLLLVGLEITVVHH